MSASRRLDRPRFTDPSPTEDAFWELTWTDVSPGDLAWHEPLVSVVDEAGAVVADDQGWRLGVVHLGSKGGMDRYAARWYSPPLGRPGRHRFVLAANNGQPETISELFD